MSLKMEEAKPRPKRPEAKVIKLAIPEQPDLSGIEMSYSQEYQEALERAVKWYEKRYDITILTVFAFGSLTNKPPRFNREKGTVNSDADFLVLYKRNSNEKGFGRLGIARQPYDFGLHSYDDGFSPRIQLSDFHFQTVEEMNSELRDRIRDMGISTLPYIGHTTYLQALMSKKIVYGKIPEGLDEKLLQNATDLFFECMRENKFSRVDPRMP